MKMKPVRNALALAVAILTASMALAASEPRILQWKPTPGGDSLTVYVRHDDSAAIEGISVGGEAVADAEIAPNAGNTALVTWLLLDCSKNMPEALRGAASDVLDALVAMKAPGETQRFCAFSDTLNEVGGVADLKRMLDASGEESGPSELGVALAEVLTQEAARDGDEFVRIVAVSTSGEMLLTGLTPGDGLSNIPVYAIGCDNGANAYALSQLRTLSARTFALYWDISEAGASDIANILRWEEIPVRVSLGVAEDWRTGAPRELELRFSDGASVRETLPFASADGIPEPPPVEETPSETPPERGRLPIRAILALTALWLALGTAVAAFFLIRRRNAPPFPANPAETPLPDSVPPVPDDDEPSEEGFPTLYLTDINRPERRFKASLRGKVTVGRAPDNAISLDYDPTISRRHCKIYLQDNALWVQDTASSIGTYVGNVRVKDAAKAPEGAVLRLGYASFKAEVR